MGTAGNSVEELDRDQFAIYRMDRETNTIELEWSEATAAMDESQFREGLSRLAGLAEAHPGMNLLVDVRGFRYRPAPDNSTWRDATIIPRYNAGRVRKMAFLLPDGAAPGSPPAPEGPADFPTWWTDSRQRIDDWFTER